VNNDFLHSSVNIRGRIIDACRGHCIEVPGREGLQESTNGLEEEREELDDEFHGQELLGPPRIFELETTGDLKPGCRLCDRIRM
jgi:hypothetical protein